ELVVVVGDPVLEPRIVDGDLSAVPSQVETPDAPVLEERPRWPYEEIAAILRSEGGAVQKADSGRRDLELPTELGVAVVCARQHEKTRKRLLRRVRDVRRRPAVLLETEVPRSGDRIDRVRGFDRLVLGDP